MVNLYLLNKTFYLIIYFKFKLIYILNIFLIINIVQLVFKIGFPAAATALRARAPELALGP